MKIAMNFLLETAPPEGSNFTKNVKRFLFIAMLKR